MYQSKNIIFVTGNQKKFEEVQALLPGVTRLSVDLPEIQELDSTKIIEAKLRAAFQYSNGPLIVDDTSCFLECLKGSGQSVDLPGPFIKWFLKAMKNTGIAQMAYQLGNVNATATTIIGYAENPETMHFFKGSISGTIILPSPGEAIGFGFDDIFKPTGYDVTFASMSMQEKNKISPRAQAIAKLVAFLKSGHFQSGVYRISSMTSSGSR